MPIDTVRGQTIKNNIKNYLKTIKSLKKCVQMLKLLKSISLKLLIITQLKEEVAALRKYIKDVDADYNEKIIRLEETIDLLRNNLEASQDTIIELARLYQNQTQLIYQLKFRLENAEKTIESIIAGNTDSLVTKITDQTAAAIPNYSYTKKEKETQADSQSIRDSH